jgi:hypothetical protein
LTDAQLQGLGAQACNLAKLDMERGKFHFLLASYHNGEQLHRMTMVENLIVEKLGEDWLSGGRTKDVGFGVMRTCVDLMPPDAFIFASMTNQFSPTEKFDQLTKKQKAELFDAGHDRHHRAVAEGLLLVRDVLTVLVQTPERICIHCQPMENGQPVGQAVSQCGPQDGFGGRMKMFGEDKKYAVS